MNLYFEFPGEPKAVQSMKVALAGKFIRKYQPKETVEWKNYIKLQALRQLPGGFFCLDTPCVISASFCFSLPKSARKRDRICVEDGIDIPKATRPDLTDNLFKGLIDALTGVVWKDDAQIVGVINSYKLYSARPRIELHVNFGVDEV